MTIHYNKQLQADFRQYQAVQHDACHWQRFGCFTQFKQYAILIKRYAIPSVELAAGWEAVMRIRCSKGLRISGFHGHFFIRSTDLLALPQVGC